MNTHHVPRTTLICACLFIIAAGCAEPKPAVSSPQPVIYVDGEVNHPGPYAWTNGMTLQDALTTAGGLTEFAPSKMRLTHPNGSIQVYRLNRERRLEENPPLQPGDKIFSPHIPL